MKISKLLLETWKRTGKQTLAAALAWAVVIAPTAAAAHEKSQGQKAASTTQAPAPVAKTSTAAQDRAPRSERPGGTREGITIRGYWVLEVRKPDGSLVARREFHNDVLGQDALVKLLSRGSSAGFWAIGFDGGSTPTDGGCGVANGAGNACFIYEVTPGPMLSSQVTIGTGINRTSTNGGKSLELKGSGTVPNAGTISRVFSLLSLCSNTTAPASPCGLNSSTLTNFSEARAPGAFQPVSLAAGQIVQLSVTFTIS